MGRVSMSGNDSGPLRSGCSTGAWSASSLLRRSAASCVVFGNALLLEKGKEWLISMRRSSGSTEDVDASGICAGISVPLGCHPGER